MSLGPPARFTVGRRHSDMPPSSALPTFYVVTPTLNSQRFIDDTILSVVQQKGPFCLRYHVQDGGSTDGTLERLRRWQELLRAGSFPGYGGSVEFSFSSAGDASMYEAINAAFSTIADGGRGYMTWINSDDRLMQGALAAAVGILGATPQLSFVTGRSAHCDEAGALTYLAPLLPYSPRSLRSGLHDNRHLYVVMQEGTVWPTELWQSAGGLDATLRYAGDFDLWRRFSEQACLVAADQVFATHRRHSGQLTSNIEGYYAEVDRMLGPAGMRERDLEWGLCHTAFGYAEAAAQLGFVGKVGRFDVAAGGWRIDSESLFPFAPATCFASAGPEGVVTTTPLVPVDGFGPREGPYPHWKLPTYCRWTTAPHCTFRVPVPVHGPSEILMVCRSPLGNCEATFRAGTSSSRSVAIPATGELKDIEVRVPIDIAEPVDCITLALHMETARQQGILFLHGHVAPILPSA